MGRLQRPLDPKAVEAADENLYAAHGSDPRPNALYDADGNQIPLDGSNPALNQEWETQYNKALNNKAPGSSDSPRENEVRGPGTGANPGGAPAPTTAPPPVFGNQPVGCATQQCAKTHKIKISLVKLRDLKERPDWWMKEKKWPYPYEPFSAVITDGPKKGALNGSGEVGYNGIPGGSCSIKFTQFYDAIVKQLDHDGIVPIASDPDDKGKSLVLKGVDAPFAPSVEKLNVSYDIHNLEKDTVIFQIESSKTPGTPIFERTLTDDEKSSGDGKLLRWDGMATLGPKSGKWIGPGDSPYTVILKVDSEGIEQKGETRVEIHKIEVEINAPKNKIILNVPETNVLVTSKVWIRQNAGGGAITPMEMEVVFRFIPNAANISAKDSFAHSAPKTLGKGGDPNAIYWEGHQEHASRSTDGYKKSCAAEVITATGGKQGTAKAWFKPSGVGGNKYKVKAEVFASDGTTSLAHKESVEVTIWRKVLFTFYEMASQSHVSQNGTNAIMAGYYTADTYVEYELGKRNPVPDPYDVMYIGLWDQATSQMLPWSTVKKKTPAEIPHPTDVTDSNGTPGQAQTAARKAIKKQAEAWRDRILKARMQSIDDWVTDAAIPENAVVGIQSDHPKISANAPITDAKTSEWANCPWLEIAIPGRKLPIHPDERWKNVQGLSYDQRAYITNNMKVARTKVVIAHEVGHETKNQFERAPFGKGDHTVTAGLMDWVASLSAFTGGEKKILRGHN